MAMWRAVLIMVCLLACLGATHTYNPWVKIPQESNVLYIRRDSIVYIVDNTGSEAARYEGKATIGLVNGEKFHCDNYSADELVEMANQ